MKITSRSAPVAETLPAEYLTLIGEICVAWSIQERALRRTVFAMLSLSEARGRLAIRTPRAKEMVDMISDLALTFGFTIDLKGLSHIDELESRRNRIAHGIWFVVDGDTYYLEDTNGKMAVDGGKGLKINKRIAPAGIPIKAEILIDLVKAIRTTTSNTYDVARAIEARLASLKKIHPAPSHPEGSQVQTKSP